MNGRNRSRVMKAVRISASLFCCLLMVGTPDVSAQKRRGRGAAPAAPTASTAQPQPALSPAEAAASQKSFEQASAEADAAREADRVDEAIALYRRGVALKPQWAE